MKKKENWKLIGILVVMEEALSCQTRTPPSADRLYVIQVVEHGVGVRGRH